MDLSGFYRGVVEDADDPERRKRYRVRVDNLHPSEVPIDTLPWAESVISGGQLYGDYPVYEKGDRVWVAFEGCNRRHAVVVGGFLSFVGGTTGVPPEIHSDYANRGGRRMIRLDRAGNKFEMSPLADEQWIKVESGDARILIRRTDSSVEIVAGSRVSQKAVLIEVEASKNVQIRSPRVESYADEDSVLHSRDALTAFGAESTVIGEYTPDTPPIPQRSTLTRVAGGKIEVQSDGLLDIDAVEDVTVDTPQDVNITATQRVRITGTGGIEVTTDQDLQATVGGRLLATVTGDVKLTAQAAVTVEAVGDVTVESDSNVTITAAQEVAVQAQSIRIEVQGGTSVSVLGNADIDVQGSASIHSDGLMTLESIAALTIKSNTRVALEAPLIDLSATTTLRAVSQGVTTIDGTQILVGL